MKLDAAYDFAQGEKASHIEFYETFSKQAQEDSDVVPIFDIQQTDNFTEYFSEGEATPMWQELLENEEMEDESLNEGYSTAIAARIFAQSMTITYKQLQKLGNSNLEAYTKLFETKSVQHVLGGIKRMQYEGMKMLSNAFDADANTYYSPDGQAIFDTAHTYRSNPDITYDNVLTSAFSPDAYNEALERYSGILDSSGAPMGGHLDTIIVAANSLAFREAKAYFNPKQMFAPVKHDDYKNEIYRGSDVTIIAVNSWSPACTRYILSDSTKPNPFRIHIKDPLHIGEPDKNVKTQSIVYPGIGAFEVGVTKAPNSVFGFAGVNAEVRG